MEFRKSIKSDVSRIMEIIRQAQEYFKLQGINQWQNNYPNKEVINNDIDNGQSYVMLKDNNIVATTVVSFKEEKSYENIIDGKWITNDKYGVIHRIAVDSNYKGLGLSHEIIKYSEELCIIYIVLELILMRKIYQCKIYLRKIISNIVELSF